MHAYQNTVGKALDDVLGDGDRGELNLADVASEAGGDEADGEIAHDGEDHGERDVPHQLRLLPALAHHLRNPHGDHRRW